MIMRPKFSRLGTEKERVINIQALLTAPHIMAIVPTFTIVHPDLFDMDDNRILEVAVAANTDLIITGDKQLLALRGISAHIVESLAEPPADDSPIPIMSPSEALDYLLSI
ncbi:MAG: hypothetical protein C7B46_02175 [Sulfobacillus benefaciens]|uniref:Toxin-antitoxin system toxin component, PIN family n=1 Tax=Sulfobacillus benefaciens TaxID=453960 RepID=A0A2T2XL59_9FIRM|nr:MAG: hypothetical protein C7B46_02175 [Sulfobacillus benefaciens]